MPALRPLPLFAALRRRCLLALGAALMAGPAFAADGLGLITILDGEASLLRDNARLALAEGVRVDAEDIIELGPKGRFLRIEFNDGASLGLGPDSRMQIAPRLPALAGGKGQPRVYLLSGWLKVSAARSGAFALATPWFEISGLTREAVISAQAEQALAFVEGGELSLRPLRPAAAPVTLKTSELLSFSGTAKPELAARPTPAFLQAVPRTFLDNLPARAPLFLGKQAHPKRLAELVYADAQPWIDAEPAVRRANLARWKPLARNPEFRKGLLGSMKAHPEWEPILFPPQAAPSAPRY